nr:NAD-dependent protein deacetylase [uncultured Noviherbaspirillum sp.]
MSSDTQDLQQMARFIERHPDALVLTGAGISTASGIPDYRDADGVRRGRAPIQGPDFRSTAAVRQRYWARSMAGWPVMQNARPNAGHAALAHMQAHGLLGPIITQNVDGLHQRAGSDGVLELHGSIHAVICLACGDRQPRAAVQQQLETLNPQFAGASAQPAPDGDAHVEPDRLDGFEVPACLRCDGMLQPDVVFFGDSVPGVRTSEARERVEHASALLVVGSSVMVHSGYRLCTRAAESGKPLAALNAGKTRADHLFCLKAGEALQEMLPALAEMLMGGTHRLT